MSQSHQSYKISSNTDQNGNVDSYSYIVIQIDCNLVKPYRRSVEYPYDIYKWSLIWKKTYYELFDTMVIISKKGFSLPTLFK